MRTIVLTHMGLALGLSVAAGTGFYPGLRFGRRTRDVMVVFPLAAIFLSPLLVPGFARFPRFLAAVFAVLVACNLYDRHAGTRADARPNILMFVVSLINPFALVMRRVSAEPRHSGARDVSRLVSGAVAGGAAIVLMVKVFLINWRQYPFALEHCAKVISFFLILQFLPHAVAAGYRLAGLAATDFAGNFFLAATPAEFWRRYNRPAGQFFAEYVFKPSGGLHRPVTATLATFVFSGVVHEYVFDIADWRFLGYQMTLFVIHGAASVATMRLRPSEWVRVPWIFLTFAFNLGTAYLFFACMNALIPFYVLRK